MLTPEQRETAICVMTNNRKVRERNKVAPVQGPMPLDWVAEQFLDALTEEFLLLHRDDVHIERCQHESTVGAPPIARLVTRWESITKEDNDA